MFKSSHYLIIVAALCVLPLTVSAQSVEPSGVRGFVATQMVDDAMGGENLVGGGATIQAGLDNRLSLGIGAAWYSDARLPEGRSYDLLTPTLDLRLSLLGDESDLALLLSPGASVYMLYQDVVGAGETRIFPSLAAGLATRLHIAGPVYAEASGVDRIHFVRDGEVATRTLGEREIVHTPELRVGLSLLFRRKEAEARFEAPPVYSPGMVPVETTRTIPPEIHATGGRTHIHDGGRTWEIDVVDGRVLLDAPLTEVDQARLGTIYFDPASDRIPDAYKAMIPQVARELEARPSASLVIRGYTSEPGGVTYNLSLAQKRGTALKDWLVRLHGIAEQRIEVVSIGVDRNANSQSLARRIDLLLHQPIE